MTAPSAWKLERAMSVLGQARERLLAEFPEMANDDALMAGMLEGETDGMEVLYSVLQSAIIYERMAADLKAFRDQLQAREDRFTRRAEKLRAMGLDAMLALDQKRIERPTFTASLGKPRVGLVITDASLLPPHLVKIKEEPDKASIRKELEAGNAVPGATLSNGSGPVLQIRTT